MQDRRLFINGKEIILSDTTRIGVTLQVNNIAELQNRQGQFTNTFTIAMADENLEALEYIHVLNSQSVVPYRRNTARYIEGGLEIIPNGEAIIRQTSQSNGVVYVETEIIAGNVDLFRAIGDIVVGDLYPTDFYEWSLDNVTNSRELNDYYIHPLIDWRTDIDTFFTSKTIDVRYMLPALRIVDLFQRLEEYTGYTFTGDYLDSAAHQNMIITPSDFEKNPEYFDLEKIASAANTVNWNSAIDVFTIDEGSGITSVTHPYTNTTGYVFQSGLGASGTTEGFGFYQAIYYPPEDNTGTMRFRGEFIMNREYVPPGLGFLESPKEAEHWFVVDIRDSTGTILAEYTADHVVGDLVNDTLTTYETYVFDIETDEVNFITSKYYFATFRIYAERHDNADTRINWSSKCELSHSPSKSIVFGNDIYFRDIFRMKVRDVLKDALLKRGILIQTDSYRKEVKFSYFQKIIDNIPNAKDWSDKIDRRSVPMTFKFGEYGQRNNFLFKENDQVTEGLGDYYFDLDDQTLDAEVDAVQVSHSATEQVNRHLGYNIPTIEAVDNLYHWNKPGWRMLQLKSQNTSFDVKYNEPNTGDFYEVDDLIPFAKFEGFDVLVPEYYSALIGILTQPKVINPMVLLSGVDIQDLDFTIPVFIDRTDLSIYGYFYINVITSYKQGLTPVQLVRL